MGQAIVILILIGVLWLAVATAIIGACQVAAQGDGVELEIDQAGGRSSSLDVIRVDQVRSPSS